MNEMPTIIVFPIATGIDGTAIANTTMGTTENGTRRFYPTAAMLTLTGVAGFLAVATASIGISGPNYTDILAAVALTGMSSLNNLIRSALLSGVSVAPNTPIVLRISVGAAATTYTVRACLEGYYL